MVEKKSMAGVLVGGSLVGLALGWLLYTPVEASVIPTKIPEAVFALIEDRCMPFLEQEALSPRGFDGRGLEPLFSGNEHIDRYTALEGDITVELSETEDGPICSVFNEFAVWSQTEIKSVVQYAMTLGPEWAGQEAITLDISSENIPFQVIFRPAVGRGKFLMAFVAPIEGGRRQFVNITIGWSEFEEYLDA